MKEILSCYIPNIVNNPYAQNVRRLLKYQGIECISIKKVLSNPSLFFRCRIFNLNWYETVHSRKEYWVKCFFLCLLKSTRKRIIYTVHNKQPHNLDKKRYSLKMMRKLVKMADVILAMCPDTMEVINSIESSAVHKIKNVLHPNYINNYCDNCSESLRTKFGFRENDLVYLFMGFISPYKNIEMLVDVFQKIANSKMKLLIAGNPCNQEYRENLEEIIGCSKNIVCDFRYIPDEEMFSYYNTCDVVVLPYKKNSSLNSGAVYLSFSLKKTVICPDIGSINALSDKSFVYDYSYVDDSEHSEKLEEAIISVFRDYDADPETIRKKGNVAFQYVSTVHSDELVSSMYGDIYRALLYKVK